MRPGRSAEPEDGPEASLAFEVRAVWGGGPVRTFAGSISLSSGSLEIVRNLSVQDDSVGTLRRISNSEVAVLPHSASSFGGADLLLKGSADSELQFQWEDPNGGRPPEPVRIKLAELLHERLMEAIDARGTRLAIERQAHDRIRVTVNDGKPILSPGQRCSLSVEGYFHNNIAAGEHRLNVRLVEEATNKVVAHYQRDVDVDAQGSFARQSFSDIELPARPGVYCFEIGLQRRRLINSFINAIAVADRKYEIVVVDDQPPASGTTEWQELAQIYPAGASWWDGVGRFRVPSVKTLTPLVSHASKSVGSEEHKRRLSGDSECLVLAPGAWQAFPLAVSDSGVPHRLTIKVLADQPQKLVLSIQESASPGDASGLKLDSGMVVDRHAAGQGEAVAHELIFWPKTAHPYLLVLNVDPAKDAAVAEITLEVAPGGLTNLHHASQTPSVQRLAAIYFDKPLLAENFGAVRRVDSRGHRELDSWRTVLEASTRLADYTQWSGHNAAILTVATQGGACYPSRALSPSPKFDSGTFLSDGSSPPIKDLTEVVCREFDRRGLKLILAIELEGTLPDLVRYESTEPGNGSLFQISEDVQTGISPEQPSTRRTTRYNPLDPRVQTALSRVIQELLQRYAQHACFAGVQINLSDRGHFNFAGDRWGYDAASLQRFQRSVGAALPTDVQERQQLFSGALRLEFLSARSRELAQFYARLADEVAESRQGAKLLINPSKLLSASASADSFADVGSRTLTASEMLRGHGIDCAALTANEQICMLRPETDSPLRAPVARAWAYQLAGDAQLDTAFRASGSGAILHQTPTGFRLPDFDKVSPLGREGSRTWLFPHASQAGDAARRGLVSRLFHADVQVLASGGWMALMGQETAVRPVLNVLKELPPLCMDDLTCDQASATLRARRIEHAGKTYLQLVNNASWHEKVVVQLQAKRQTTLRLLGAVDDQPRIIPAGQPYILQLPMSPYSLAGVCVDADDITLASLTSAPEAEVGEQLQRRLAELQVCIDRAGELNEQQTLGLRGGDFEAWDSDGKPTGWTVSTHPSTAVTEERELPRSGNRCVRIDNNGNGAATAWIQSDRIAIPSTGRLALEVWVRSAPGLAQPSVRLSVIGRDREGKRFQRWHDFVPASSGGTQIPIDWGRRPLVLLVPDVPNEDLTELQVAVDLIGAGRLWVDDVRVYGMYLHPDEQVHLLGQMFLANERMRKGDFSLADQLLDSFWACFLFSYLSPSGSTTGPTAATAGTAKTATGAGPASGEKFSGEPRMTKSGGTAATAAQSAGDKRLSGKTPSDQSANNESKPPSRASGTVPTWRSSSQPRFNQWQEALRQRWQR